MSQKLISVVIPNLNSPVIAKTLAALHRQNFDLSRCEVLVVGLDEPKQVVSDELVQFISTGKAQSAAKNRNLGIARACGEILCFTDADCEPHQDWLQRISGYFEQTDVQVVGGSISFQDDSYWSTCDNLSWFYNFLSSSAKGKRQHLPTCNLAVHRQVIQQIGGMDESFPVAAGEDTEWTTRMRQAGISLFFDPDLVVTHLARRSTWRLLWSHGYRYGQFSLKIRQGEVGDAGRAGLYAYLPRSRVWLLLLAPVIATFITLRIVLLQPGWNTVKAIPGIWLSKLAWCLGASHSLRRECVGE